MTAEIPAGRELTGREFLAGIDPAAKPYIPEVDGDDEPLSPEREAEIRAFEENEHRNVLTMGRDLEDVLAELDRVRTELEARDSAMATYTAQLQKDQKRLRLIRTAVLQINGAELNTWARGWMACAKPVLTILGPDGESDGATSGGPCCGRASVGLSHAHNCQAKEAQE